mmetsp:Transcript_15971/g.26098  ORF Transcript_15971/g.26098 Transcript_15971/m.26098 type:complete len:767 (-) Transcript_15971:1560-3860(-)|eukprot:CAMPEP_0203765198 /NCGR_PEP_ID=MMETSP0098-20131031/18278_1 /ASSEMBLY_ACC=CAM_ASM_000208 /TAXON_ID=96639 /ORGANISM=" , Strain NY0313808BC1" /LENGTH=766 /DNA_ID=CAMNT_0050661429 /DNA_START=5237 /DNA_END=7537 /DNA_ORIENTATION=-
MATLDDSFELIQQGSITFAVISATLFYFADQIPILKEWGQYLLGSRPESRQRPGMSTLSPDTRVRKVVVRSGTLVDGLVFYYDDGNVEHKIAFGGTGGNENPPFELQQDEYIIQVKGHKGAYVDQIQFVTNLGRVSPVYGGPGGEEFSHSLPGGEAIGGLDVAVSINGWLRSVHRALSVSQVNVMPPEDPWHIQQGGIVKPHSRRVRTRLRLVHLLILAYGSFLMFALHNFVIDVITGPTALDVHSLSSEPQHSFVTIPEQTRAIASSDIFSDGQDTFRWIVFDVNPSHDASQSTATVGVVVKELVARVGEDQVEAADIADQSQPRTGMVRRIDFKNQVLYDLFTEKLEKALDLSRFRWLWSAFENDDSSAGTKQRTERLPYYYVDESFSPMLFFVCVICTISVFAYTAQSEWKQSRGMDNPVINRFRSSWDEQSEGKTLEEIAQEIDEEVLEPSTLVLPWNSSVVAVTKNWLIKTNYLGLDAIAINDAKLVDLRVSGRWIMGELVEMVTLRIESRRSVTQHGHHRGRATYFFDVALPRIQFESLQSSFIDRVNKRQEEQVKQRQDSFIASYYNMLINRVADGITYPKENGSGVECLGACGKTTNVIVQKRCNTCEERHECLCDPSWCHMCLLKWWFTKNRTRIELLSHTEMIEPTWQAQCPTCRIYFCMNDVVPREDFEATMGDEQPNTESSSTVVDEVTEEQTHVKEDDDDLDGTDQDDGQEEDIVNETTPDPSGDSVSEPREQNERRARAAAAAERRRRLTPQ